MSTSKLQKETSKLLGIHFGDCTIRENTKPDWLTAGDGARLELDFIIEEKRCAIEVQGSQHYEYTPFFHEGYAEFQICLARDRRKREICLDRGILLYEIASERDLQIAIENIRKRTTITQGKVKDVVKLALKQFFPPREKMLTRDRRKQEKKYAECIQQVQKVIGRITSYGTPLTRSRAMMISHTLRMASAWIARGEKVNDSEYYLLYRTLCMMDFV